MIDHVLIKLFLNIWRSVVEKYFGTTANLIVSSIGLNACKSSLQNNKQRCMARIKANMKSVIMYFSFIVLNNTFFFFFFKQHPYNT